MRDVSLQPEALLRRLLPARRPRDSGAASDASDLASAAKPPMMRVPPRRQAARSGSRAGMVALSEIRRHATHAVAVGPVVIGGGAPVVVQSMTNTDTADVDATVRQVIELADAGSEIVRITVNNDEAAKAVPQIRDRLLLRGYDVPLVGDFHYNGHLFLTRYPDCAKALAKLRINPGNVGFGEKRDQQFEMMIEAALRARQAGAHRRQLGQPRPSCRPG